MMVCVSPSVSDLPADCHIVCFGMACKSLTSHTANVNHNGNGIVMRGTGDHDWMRSCGSKFHDSVCEFAADASMIIVFQIGGDRFGRGGLRLLGV
jgi:hypothetical protein